MHPWGMAVNDDLPGRRREKAARQLDEGGLSRSVGAQKTDDPHALYLQINLVQGRLPAICLRQDVYKRQLSLWAVQDAILTA